MFKKQVIAKIHKQVLFKKKYSTFQYVYNLLHLSSSIWTQVFYVCKKGKQINLKQLYAVPGLIYVLHFFLFRCFVTGFYCVIFIFDSIDQPVRSDYKANMWLGRLRHFITKWEFNLSKRCVILFTFFEKSAKTSFQIKATLQYTLKPLWKIISQKYVILQITVDFSGILLKREKGLTERVIKTDVVSFEWLTTLFYLLKSRLMDTLVLHWKTSQWIQSINHFKNI